MTDLHTIAPRLAKARDQHLAEQEARHRLRASFAALAAAAEETAARAGLIFGAFARNVERLGRR